MPFSGLPCVDRPDWYDASGPVDYGLKGPAHRGVVSLEDGI